MYMTALKGKTALNFVVAVAFGVTVFAVAASAQLNLVYVESNIGSESGMNSVFAFTNNGAGLLTPLAGSPFLTSGTGVYSPSDHTPFFADQQVIVNQAGTLLFAVNGHTNTIAVFNIDSSGGLSPIVGSPFSSGGRQPASLGLTDGILSDGNSLLAVVNKDSDSSQPAGTPTYKVFTVSSTGTLTGIPSSVITLPAGSSPAQALVRKNGRLVFTLEFLAPTITSWVFKGQGILSQVSQVSPPISGADPLGEALHPTQRVLYVALPTVNQIAVYSYDAGGNLTFDETIPNVGDAVCWLTVNQAGTRLYSVETESQSVSVYDLTVPTAPVMLQNSKISGPFGPTNEALDPTGKFLYVLAAANLHVLNVASDGTLSETLSPVVLPVPAGEIPLGIATLMK
jgi:6-phosphogluconolactonase (cycloisomerase 2 family)